MIAWFAKHPTAANLLMVILIAIGAFTVPGIKKETLPTIESNIVRVAVIYRGATAEEIEAKIVTPIEQALDGIEYVKEINTECVEDRGTVSIEMEASGTVSEFKDEIQNAIDSMDDLPDDAEMPTVTLVSRLEPAITMMVRADADEFALRKHCDAIKARLLELPEVSLVEVEGFSDQVLNVEINRYNLERYQLTIESVANTIRNQNRASAVGVFETNSKENLIRFGSEARTKNEIENLVLLAEQGSNELRIKDIATVTLEPEMAYSKIMFNGDRAGKLIVKKSQQEDIIKVANAVKDFVLLEQQRYPSVQLDITNDTSELVTDRLGLLVKNGLQGLLLVFVSLWLFFSWRLSFWVAASLPVSFLGGLFFFPLLGLSLNMFTLLALLLALGILMDDGIVIAENIAAKFEEGFAPMDAAIQGLGGVIGGVTSSFITTICVLGPLGFLSGNIGQVLRVIPIVLIVVLAVSLVEAFGILPSHLGHALGGRSESPNRFRKFIDSALAFVRDGLFATFVEWALCWRYLVIGTAIGLLLLCVSLVAAGLIRFQPFPNLEGDTVVARVLLPAGTRLEKTELVVAQMLSELDLTNQRLSKNESKGDSLVKNTTVEFGVNTEAFESGAHVATVTVELKSVQSRNTRLDDFVSAWSDAVGQPADVSWISIGADAFGPAGRPIEVRLQGRDLRQLQRAAFDTKQWFEKFAGTRNLTVDLRQGKPELEFQVDSGSTGLGLNSNTIGQQLRAAVFGVEVGELVGPNSASTESPKIKVRMQADANQSLQDLDLFPIALPDGTLVPLEAVANKKQVRGWSRIAHVDGLPTVTLRGDVDMRVASGANLVSIFKSEQAEKITEKFPETRFAFGGETQESQKTAASMAKGAMLGMLGVFALLSLQFRNYFEPIIVMIAIPLALIGVIVGHLLLGVDLSMPSMLGLISLAGIVVNDSILLVLFLKESRHKFANLSDAAIEAVRQRFRAILLTSLTTVAGLVPLLFETSLQAQVLIPIAISIAFGIMSSTILILVVIPSAYVVLGDFGLAD